MGVSIRTTKLVRELLLNGLELRSLRTLLPKLTFTKQISQLKKKGKEEERETTPSWTEGRASNWDWSKVGRSNTAPPPPRSDPNPPLMAARESADASLLRAFSNLAVVRRLRGNEAFEMGRAVGLGFGNLGTENAAPRVLIAIEELCVHSLWAEAQGREYGLVKTRLGRYEGE